jgi:hypothetical protein
MTRGIVMASIVAAAILLAAPAMIYFSAYQTCVRAWQGQVGTRNAQIGCAHSVISN